MDDFACTGNVDDLRWFEKSVSEYFELKSEILGPGHSEVREVKFLGRRIQWKKNGITYQADPKHVNILSEEWDLRDCKFVGTPGTADEKLKGNMEEKELLNKESSRKYRRAAARLKTI